ncbi:sulfotransferase domain-containing protein [Paraburkholderia sp. WC7.3g]|uniref:sulfotransferase domain-containing protein n=1 Tax=Paraburkholderia sp. WC7.3g TaxID=2991070 RepID=UPI003D2604BD
MQTIFRDEQTRARLAAAIEPWMADELARTIDCVAVDGGHFQGRLKERCLETLAPELIRAIFKVLLGREPEEEAIGHYTPLLLTQNGIEHVLSIVMESGECRRRWRSSPYVLPHPSLTRDDPVTVFLHIQKTGGTSLQNMITDAFSDQPVYREHADTLYLRSAAELAQYRLFLGHFNYDSISYIPKSRISVVTFLRDPKQRLVSLYRFWRAHESDHPSFHEKMALANQLGMEEFCRTISSWREYETWNHIAWAVMGERGWMHWTTRMEAAEADQADKVSILQEFRHAARERLNEFSFIGMQDDFARSTAMLADILKRPDLNPRHDHAVNQLIGTELFFKKCLPEVSSTPGLDRAIAELTQLDSIIYDEARQIYLQALGSEHSTK